MASSGWKGHADLADEDQVKADAERLRYLSSDRNAATRQRQDGGLPSLVLRERCRESVSRIRSILNAMCFLHSEHGKAA